MGAAATRAMKQAVTRLRAWWDASEAEPALEAGAVRAPFANPAAGPAAVLADARLRAAGAAMAHLWGAGRTGPTDAEDAARRIAMLGLKRGQTLGWIGAGGAGDMAEAGGLQVEAFEWRPAWRGPAMAPSDPDRAGAVHLHPLDLAAPELPLSAFDGVACVDRLWEAQDPAPLLAAMARALREGGLCAVEEPVLDEAAPAGEQPLGEGAPQAADLETWRARFTDAGLDVRLAQDGTGLALARLSAAIDRFAETFDEVTAAILRDPDGKFIAYELTFALNAALRRISALERGDLAIYRFLAAKVA